MRFSIRENHGLKSKFKNWVLPAGKSPRRIRVGLLGGLTMQLDFAHQTQRWCGLQERELYGWIHRFSRGIQTAFDVGANDGMYTLYFLARTPAQKIFCIEPSAESLLELKENLALNKLAVDDRLEIIPKKAGSKSGNEWTTLDAFYPHTAAPCLVKVDIDGGEGDLLQGAQSLLRAAGTRWIIEVHSKALEKECLQVLKDANYRTVVVHNAWWRHIVPELRPGELNHWLVAFRSGTAV